ncbi:MAG: DUF4007 family protein [Armatimonadota bacterium]|nr:DUF4007 family protein [Armatimonadota bacterium]
MYNNNAASAGASPRAALLPANPSFAGHQTFVLRWGWLKKGLDALTDGKHGGPDFFTRKDALVHLGVGKNMVQSIRYWLLATRMAHEVPDTRGRALEPTPLGCLLLGKAGDAEAGWDPFLEDDATAWLLHWLLAGPGSLSFTWVWTFNCFREYEFSRETLVESVFAGAEVSVRKAPSRETVARDVECLLHTYAGAGKSRGSLEDLLGCPLGYLKLIQPAFDRQFRFAIGAKPSLPPRIFYYAMVEYWQWRWANSLTVSVRDLSFDEGSPGRVFKLDEESVLAYLDGLSDETAGRLRFEDTPLTREVVRDGGADLESLKQEFLGKYYGA